MTTAAEVKSELEPPKFTPWPKIPRLFRECTITEKIDGTNAAIHIVPWEPSFSVFDSTVTAYSNFHFPLVTMSLTLGGQIYGFWAQSRKRLLSTNPGGDNHGFVQWVQSNAESLLADLGEGLHYGEWWGSGINRGYGLHEKRFSLFNTKRWGGVEFKTPGLACVPVLHEGQFSTQSARYWLRQLAEEGSRAAPGYDKPEGVVVFHKAANELFKITIEGDDAPKGQ